MATLDTPGTAMSRGRIVHRASTPISNGVRSLDDREIMDVRALADVGCSICGGLDTCGSPAAWLMRSCTTWRAR